MKSFVRWDLVSTSERRRNAGCAGCIYVDEHYHCNYYLILGPGHRREAPMYEGGGCARYTSGTRRRGTWDGWLLTDRQVRKAKRTAGRPAGPLDTARAGELYRAGASDVQIASKLGVSKGMVWRWRQREGLPSHRKKQKEG